MSSKRARALVAASLLAGRTPVVENENFSPAGQLAESPVPSEISSVPSWWDGIFEASDIWKSSRVQPSAVTAVKRNLFDEKVLEKESQNLIVLNALKAKPVVITSPVKRVCREATLSPSKQEVFDDPYLSDAQRCDLQLESGTPALELNVEAQATLESHGCDLNRNIPSPQKSCCTVPHSSLSQVDLPPNSNQINAPSRLRIHEAKVALNSGLQHTTPSGKLRAARKVKPPCPSVCKRCGSPRLSEDERSQIFKSFWALGDHTSQWKFISMCVKCSVPRKKCTSKGSKGEKHASREYCFEVNGSLKRVCKTMFKNTLAICDSWVDSALSHSHSGSTLQDQRGQRSRNTASQESAENVRD